MRLLERVRFIERTVAVTVALSWVFGVFYAAAEPVLYGIDEQNDQLVTIDRNTSAITVVGPLGVTRLTGLTYNTATKTLLAAGRGVEKHSTVYTVNMWTGAAEKKEAVVPRTARIAEAVAYEAPTGRLYLLAAGRGVSQLHMLDGEFFLPIGLREGMEVTGGFTAIQGLAYDSARDKLYAVDQSSDRLLTLDPLTGAGTNVGSLGLNSLTSLAYDAESDQIYGWDSGLDQLVVLDRETGHATPVPLPEGVSNEDTFVRGLAFVPAADVTHRSAGGPAGSPASQESAQD